MTEAKENDDLPIGCRAGCTAVPLEVTLYSHPPDLQVKVAFIEGGLRNFLSQYITNGANRCAVEHVACSRRRVGSFGFSGA